MLGRVFEVARVATPVHRKGARADNKPVGVYLLHDERVVLVDGLLHHRVLLELPVNEGVVPVFLLALRRLEVDSSHVVLGVDKLPSLALMAALVRPFLLLRRTPLRWEEKILFLGRPPEPDGQLQLSAFGRLRKHLGSLH